MKCLDVLYRQLLELALAENRDYVRLGVPRIHLDNVWITCAQSISKTVVTPSPTVYSIVAVTIPSS